MAKNPLPLAGKAALVTGGSRGIGAAIVRRLAEEGADVAFSYSAAREPADKVVKAIEALGRRALAVKADQAIPDQAAGLVRQAHAAFGHLDILVNSAGIFALGMVGDPATDTDHLDRLLDINLKGVVATVRAAVPLLSDGGRIVCIGTAAASHVPFPGAADYVASKAAVAGYSRGLARELGGRRITINVVQPGPINTEMNPEDGPMAEPMKLLTALKRYGQPEEVAAAVAFLAGPDAGYITGAILNVDGGMAA